MNEYAYLYDLAGNRLQEQINGVNRRSAYNRLNQLVIENASGEGSRMRFTGTTSGESRVTVNGVVARRLANHSSLNMPHYFEAWVEMRQGDNEIEILAYDTAKKRHVAKFKVNVPSTEPQTLSYDADGNLLEDATRKFTWDAKNQLREIEFKDGSGFIEFSYDASGRRVKMVRKDASETVIEEKRYLWLPGGNQPYEEYDVVNGNMILSRRFFGQGEQVFIDGVLQENLFYTTDHLGSVRELVDSNVTVQAVYDYDPFGRRTKVSGTGDTVVSYTGHHWHEKSGIYLTWFRQYDPNLGRWLNRDPIGERGGINLYGYVTNNPTNVTDPLGLFGSGDGTYKGHGDFTTPNWEQSRNDPEFNFNAQDEGDNRPIFRSIFRSGFTGLLDIILGRWNPADHFQNRGQTEPAIRAAIEKCDTRAYSDAMHNHQDTFVHRQGRREHRWAPGGGRFGHAGSGSVPDQDNERWEMAEVATLYWNSEWRQKCCKIGNSPWFKRRYR